MGMTPIGAEAPVAGLHRHTESGGDRLLPDRQVTGAFDQILEEQIIGAFFEHADFELAAVQGQPLRRVDLCIFSRPRRNRSLYFFQDHIL